VAVRRLVNKAGDLLDDLMLLYRADIMARTAPYNDLSEFNHLMERIKLLDLDALIDVKSPLPGEEVMSILGIAAGPEVGEAQKDIEQAIIDGKIAATESDAKAYLENEFKRKK
jgi:poly(A) polymerase